MMYERFLGEQHCLSCTLLTVALSLINVFKLQSDAAPFILQSIHGIRHVASCSHESIPEAQTLKILGYTKYSYY